MRALIIENDQSCRELLEHTFAQQGIVTDSGDSIASARAYADSVYYDLICVNQALSDGPGEDFIAYCNQHDNHRDTPVLLLTENLSLEAGDLPVRVSGVIHELNRHQIGDQIVHFIEMHLDPVFFEGRILFVEDDEKTASDILEHLKETGYQVSHFSKAEDAAEEFDTVTVYGSHAEAYDLAITGVHLEGEMTGDDLVTRIRSYHDGRGFIPIMVMTNDKDDRRRIALYRAGVNDFLPKPVLHEELLARIGNLITNKRLLDKVHDIRRELYALATIDRLTGCYNRHALMEFSEKFISSARRHRYPVSMLVIDLDHFKAVNDNHGHAVGDQVLEAMGALLNRNFREGDLVTRYGGEEFVVLMTHCCGEDALRKAEKIRGGIQELKPGDLEITASIGVTSIEVGSSSDFEAMFYAGDEGVYAAKKSGRNQVVFVAQDRSS